MTGPAALRQKTVPAASEVRRLPTERLAASPAPQTLSASVRLGGAHDAEEREAEAAAATISAGGRHRVSDAGGVGYLRAQGATKLADPGASGRLRALAAERLADPGAGGRIRSSPVGETPARPAQAERLIDPGASGQIRRLPASESLWARNRAMAASKVDRARHSPSRPLPETVRARLEHGFGQSLHSVRVHNDPTARAAASAIGARAFTEGERITLGRGESEHDLRLIAHETAHVIQNRRAAGTFRPAPQEPARAEPEAKPPGLLRRAAAALGMVPRPAAEPARAAALRDNAVRATAEVPGPIRRLSFDDALDWIADKANFIPGFRLLTVILGRNPINGAAVDRSGANILRAAIDFLPGGELIVRALDTYGVIDKAGAFIDAQVKSLGMAAESLRDALMDFLHSLSWTDIFDLGGVWDRAKRIFTAPIDRIKDFFVGVAEAIIHFVKDAILKPLAALASKTPAWDILISVLGKDPISGEPAPPLGDAIVGGLLKMAGQEEIWENIQKSGAKGRIIAWVKTNIAALKGFVQEIPSLFINALKAFKIDSLLDLPGAFAKVLGIFGDFAGRFISWVGNAVWELLKIVFDVVSPSAWGYVQRTGAALKSILKNPLPFVKNLVAAAKLGLSNFADNIVDHLKAALIDWLVGSLPGIYIPKSFSLAEFGKLALSVLGITWAQIRAKIVKALGPSGETIMSALEKVFTVVKALIDGGPAAAWEAIKEQLTNLKDMVVDGIVGFVKDTVVQKAIPKLVAMFIPGAGFISAIVSIYDTVKVFIEKLSKIAQVAMAFINSIVAIAAGQIAGAAKTVESTLAGLLSLAISFLAGFVGLGDVAEKLRGVIKKVQDFVDKALDKAITFIIAKAKALFAKLFGKRDERSEEGKKKDLEKAVTTIKPLADALLASNPNKKKLQKQLNKWKTQYRLTALTAEGGDIKAAINPELTVTQKEDQKLGVMIEPILIQAEAQYLALLKGPEEQEDLAGPGYGPPSEAEIYGAMAAGSRPGPSPEAGRILDFRSLREDPSSAPRTSAFLPTPLGAAVRYGDPRSPDVFTLSTTFVKTPRGEERYTKMPPVPNVPYAGLDPRHQELLALEQARSKGMATAMQTARGLRDAGIITTDEMLRGPYNPMAPETTAGKAEKESFGDIPKARSWSPGQARPEEKKKGVPRGSKRHIGIGAIFRELRGLLNRPEYEVVSKPGGASLLSLAKAVEAWFNASKPPEGQKLDEAKVQNLADALKSKFVAFLNERLSK